jgi:PDZ domain-containing protein
VTVLRDGEELTRSVPTQVGAGGRTVVGIFPTDSYELPFTIDIGIDRVGGPSAGLLLALGIVDKLTPGALTGGAHIAGTGTIDGDGTVGRIGGIEQKVVAAQEVGATVFLVPADNCAEAVGAAPKGLQLVRVNTLEDALDALAAIRDGAGSVPLCAR